MGSFFYKLKLWWNTCSLLGLFFNELELRVKLLMIMVIDIRLTVNTMFFWGSYYLFNCSIKLIRHWEYILEKWAKKLIPYLNYVKSNLKVVFTPHFTISFGFVIVVALEVFSPLIFISWFWEILWTIFWTNWTRQELNLSSSIAFFPFWILSMFSCFSGPLGFEHFVLPPHT